MGPPHPGRGDSPTGGGQPGCSDRRDAFPPGLPVRQAPGGPPGDGGDGGGPGGDDDETPLCTDEDPNLPRHPKPQGDPDSSGGVADKECLGQGPVSMNNNKWAKPIPKLELPPRAHLQKASKTKQIRKRGL